MASRELVAVVLVGGPLDGHTSEVPAGSTWLGVRDWTATGPGIVGSYRDSGIRDGQGMPIWGWEPIR